MQRVNKKDLVLLAHCPVHFWLGSFVVAYPVRLKHVPARFIDIGMFMLSQRLNIPEPQTQRLNIPEPQTSSVQYTVLARQDTPKSCPEPKCQHLVEGSLTSCQASKATVPAVYLFLTTPVLLR